MIESHFGFISTVVTPSFVIILFYNVFTTFSSLWNVSSVCLGLFNRVCGKKMMTCLYVDYEIDVFVYLYMELFMFAWDFIGLFNMFSWTYMGSYFYMYACMELYEFA